jgi:hypothetical protein
VGISKTEKPSQYRLIRLNEYSVVIGGWKFP